MIQTILGFCGYVKIPIEAVQLSIAQEEFLSRCAKLETDAKGKEYFEGHLKGQKMLTGFLRSGRLLACFVAMVMLAGCMSVNITASGPGSVTVNLDKAVSTLPVNASGNTVPVSAMP